MGEEHIALGTLKEIHTNSENTLILENEPYLLALERFGDLRRLIHHKIHARFFNEVQLTAEHITKTSTNKDKIQQEFAFLSTIPEDLQPYFAPVSDYEETKTTTSYKLQHIKALDASLLYINGSLMGKQLQRFLEDLHTYFQKTKPYKTKADDATWAFIADKITQRHTQLKKWSHYPELENFIANHTAFSSLEDVYTALQNALLKEKKALLKAGAGFSHGDLCLSNILYDEQAEILTFIDPRGGIATRTCRSPYYDFAKLSHSLLGGYDHIINNLAKVHFDDDMHAHLTFDAGNMPQTEKDFTAFIKRNKLSPKLVRLVEASLFLSMLPLHTESTRKVYMLALRGVEILQKSKNMRG